MTQSENYARERRLSWWLDEALSLAEPPAPALRGSTTADVCIVGGGYSGLWTAIELKQRDPSIDVVLIEAGICGTGASGRNGGMMLSWWAKLGTLTEMFGAEDAIRLAQASADAIDDIEKFCVDHEIDAHFHKDGWYWAATNTAQMGAWNGAIETAAEHGRQPFVPLTADEAQSYGGSPIHVGGVFEPTGATVQPALLARGLYQVAAKLGVRIYENTPMSDWSSGQQVRITTKDGTIVADRAVMATNAWMVREKQIARSLVVVTSDMLVTKPIPELLEVTGPRPGVGVSDSRMLVNYYRTTNDGRLAFGHGGGSFAFGRSVGRSADQACWRTDAVSQAMTELYPKLGADLMHSSWTGPIDRSISSVPFFGSLDERRKVFYGVGYSGNGVGPTYLGGKILAGLAMGVKDEWTTSRIAQGPVGTYPPEPIKYIGGLTLRAVLARKERLEDQERTPGLVIRAMSKLAPPGLVPVRREAKPQETKES